MEPLTPQIKKPLVLIMFVLLTITVAIAGLFYFQIQKLSKELSKYQTQPSPTPSASQAPTGDMANWKTYANNDLEFTLKYPPEWPDPKETLLSTSTEVSFNDNLTIRIGVFYNQDLGRNSTFDEVVEKYLPTDGTPAGSFTIAGREAKQIVYKTGESLFETLIMIPSPISKDGIVTISYKIFLGDTTLQNKQIDQILSTFKFLGQNIVLDNCVDEKDSILTVVSTFENLQKNKDAKGVLALFTPPQSQEETSNYQNLSGEDAQVSPRLYNNVSTNYNTLSYKITQQPAKLPGELCNVTAEEQRSNYGGPTNPQYLPAQTEEFVLILTKLDGKWKIDQYQSGDPKIKKGKYAGFLMEY